MQKQRQKEKQEYVKRPGDYELRFLPDGRLVFIGPDETLLELAKNFKLAAENHKDQEV